MELVIDRVSKQYKNLIALDRVSLKLHKGVYGLLGANGLRYKLKKLSFTSLR